MTGRNAWKGPTEREVEQWKEGVRLDIAEERNPGTDEFAKGFNDGLRKARDMIYARLPQLLLAKPTTRSPVEDARGELVEALKSIQAEAKVANDVIALRRDKDGQGRIKVATAMHRIARLADEALRASEGNRS